SVISSSVSSGAICWDCGRCTVRGRPSGHSEGCAWLAESPTSSVVPGVVIREFSSHASDVVPTMQQPQPTFRWPDRLGTLHMWAYVQVSAALKVPGST